MNKKDRRAAAISVSFIIFGAIPLLVGGVTNLFVFVILILAAYWGYRFTRGDISFFIGSDE